LCFSNRKLRQFFGLGCIEAQLPENHTLVSAMVREITTDGFFEAFLESAPQLIFQLTIIVRSGFISNYFVDKAIDKENAHPASLILQNKTKPWNHLDNSNFSYLPDVFIYFAQ
jgi:hypothetical protein